MIAHETIRELAQSWLICMIIADIINTTQHHTSAFLTLHQYSCSGCFSVIFGLLIVVCWCMNQSAKDMCRPFNIIFTANESTLPLCHNSVKPQKQTNKSKKNKSGQQWSNTAGTPKTAWTAFTGCYSKLKSRHPHKCPVFLRTLVSLSDHHFPPILSHPILSYPILSWPDLSQGMSARAPVHIRCAWHLHSSPAFYNSKYELHCRAK